MGDAQLIDYLQEKNIFEGLRTSQEIFILVSKFYKIFDAKRYVITTINESCKKLVLHSHLKAKSICRTREIKLQYLAYDK